MARGAESSGAMNRASASIAITPQSRAPRRRLAHLVLAAGTPRTIRAPHATATSKCGVLRSQLAGQRTGRDRGAGDQPEHPERSPPRATPVLGNPDPVIELRAASTIPVKSTA